jgi:hypothetical protein
MKLRTNLLSFLLLIVLLVLTFGLAFAQESDEQPEPYRSRLAVHGYLAKQKEEVPLPDNRGVAYIPNNRYCLLPKDSL